MLLDFFVIFPLMLLIVGSLTFVGFQIHEMWKERQGRVYRVSGNETSPID